MESFRGKAFFVRYMARLTRVLRRLPARLYQAVDPVALPSARIAAGHSRSRYCYFSLEYFQGTDQMVGRPLTRAAWYQIERWGLARAAASAVVCQATAHRLAARFRVAEPHVIRNVPLLSETAAEPDGQLRRDTGVSADTPLAVFKGDIGSGRGLVPFVKALADEPSMHFALLGEGPLRPALEALCGERGVQQRVHFVGRVAPERFPALLKEGDLGHSMHERVGTNMPYTLPSKLFDYLHAGLPVLCGDVGEMADIVRGHGVGWAVDASDVRAVAAALHEASDRMATGPLRARAHAASREFCWDSEQVHYLDYIRQALG